jgi:predicted amidohydrolase
MALLAESIQTASEAGASLLVTPECFLNGYHIGREATEQRAFARDAQTLKDLSALARAHSMALVVGYASRTNQQLHNVVSCWSDSGELLASYRKTHLFGETDRSRFTPGERLSPIVQIAGVNVALAICFDVEFPELARAYADAGANLIVVPTASMKPYDSIPMRMVPTRAEENGLFIAYANYCGHEREFEYTGLSCICGPDGHDLARAQRSATIITADINLQAQTQTRGEIDYLNERRVDLYPDPGES